MRSQIELVFGAFLLVQARAQVESLSRERAYTAATIPNCSLACLTTLVPKYCGTLTNTTCICTSTELTVAVTPCALAACNITEALQLQRYAAESCGISDDKTHLNEEWHGIYSVPTIATIFVVARIFVRAKLDIGLGADDWMMVAALCAYLTDIGVGLGLTLNGFGRHTFWLTTHQITMALMFLYIGEFFYLLTITLTKLSLLLFFRRIFPNRSFRIAIWIMYSFVIASNFSIAMAALVQCLPFHANWTNWMYKVAPVKCLNSFTIAYVAAVMSIFHDFVILFMPIPILWRLNLAWRKKAHLLVMFSVGFFAIACSLVRLPLLMKLNSSSDPSYDQAPIIFWSGLENGVGIICGCLPACRSLIGHFFSGLKRSPGASSGNTAEAYSTQHRSKTKLDGKHLESSKKTFIELDDYTENQNELEKGPAESATTRSQNSETPIHG